MRPIPFFRASSSQKLPLILAIQCLLACAAFSADFNWDPASTGTSTGGGAGAWNLTTPARWYNGSSDVIWANTGNDRAIFGGTNGTVTLGAPILVNAITVNTASYTIAGSTTNNLTFQGTAPEIVGNEAFIISAPVVTNTLVEIKGDGGGSDNINISGPVSGTGSFRVNANSRFYLTSGNTFSGGVTVNGGVFIAQTNTTGNALGTGTLTLNGGTFATRYAGDATGGTSTAVLSPVVVTANTTFDLRRTGSTDNVTMQMTTLGIGSNTISVTGANQYGLEFTGATTLSGNAGFSITSSVGSTTKTGVILNDVGQTGGARNISKSGVGSMSINGTSTYTGTTSISAGSLYINGNASAAIGNVSAAGGATLGGSGTIGGATTITGSHAPGAFGIIGTQTFNNSLAYVAASTFQWQLNAGTVDPGADALNSGSYDRVIANSTVTGTSVFQISLTSGGFTDAFWDTNKSWTNIFGGTGTYDLDSVFTSFGGSAAADGTVIGEGKFSFADNTLNWTAVPEPTLALALPSLALGLLRRRRK